MDKNDSIEAETYVVDTIPVITPPNMSDKSKWVNYTGFKEVSLSFVGS